jgi:hypothetical protein
VGDPRLRCAGGPGVLGLLHAAVSALAGAAGLHVRGDLRGAALARASAGPSATARPAAPGRVDAGADHDAARAGLFLLCRSRRARRVRGERLSGAAAPARW